MWLPPFIWKWLGKNAVEPPPVINTKPMLITQQQLKSIAPSLKGDKLKSICDLLNELCPKYGITDKEVFKMFLANVAQESGEFAHKEENMNYRAETIVKTWPGRFPTIAAAASFALNPEALANKVYGGRMGNNQPGDGFLFKGAGFIGITGRELYTKYAKYIQQPVEITANLMKTQDRYALDSACWFFAVLKNLIAVAKTGDFIKVVKGINGGTIGLRDRQLYYNRCNKFIS